MKDFRPDLVIISAGFDSRQGDPLGDFTLSDQDFSELTRILQELAGEFAEQRLVSVLEGGYNQKGLALAVRHHLETLLGSE
jgi:acetoin utilization deacetylase AcuC-like enzyme